MINKEKYKKAFSDIRVSKKLERNILSMTEKRQRKANTVFKFSYASLLIIFICVISLSVVYASDIKKWVSSIFMDDGTELKLNNDSNFIHIKDSASKEDNIQMNLNEVEDMLGVDYLSSDYFTTDIVYYMPTIIKENIIERVTLWFPSCIKYDEQKNISAQFSLLTDKATDAVTLSDQGIDATGGKELKKEYTSENLGVKVIIYGVNWEQSRLTATFVYNNINYKFIGNGVSSKELIDIIESLK